MNPDRLEKACAVLRNAGQGPVPVFEFGETLTGFSGERLLACLHGLTAALCDEQRVYLEIGVFQGLTLLSNSKVNPGIACLGIDNFSLFNEGKDNFEIVRLRMSQLGVHNAIIINKDFEEALHGLESDLGTRKIGVFFVDGAHDYRSQLVSLLKAKPHLAEGCAIVVDDANYAHVRQANADFLRSHPDFALLMEAYTPGHMANLIGEDRVAASAGFWNGVNVMFHDPEHRVPRAFPREESKELHFQSHDVFRHEFGELAFPALKAIQESLDDSGAGLDSLAAIRQVFAEQRRRHPERFRHQNTGSRDLPSFRLYC
jgi:hypothetical protein